MIHILVARFAVFRIIFLLFEVTEWAQQERQPSAIMLLEFEKAYDSC